MKKKRDTFEQGIEIYNARYGKAPTISEIIDLWHRYANEWKHFDGFADWLTYHE